MNFILNHVPPWLYVTVITLACAVAFYFLSPVLVPLWAVTPKPIKWAVGSVVTVVGALLAGRYYGARSEREAEKQRDADAINKRMEVDNDVDKMSRSDTDKRLDRWTE